MCYLVGRNKAKSSEAGVQLERKPCLCVAIAQVD